MRLSSRDMQFNVGIMRDSQRPIRVRAGGFTYCLTEPEAIDLANRLADVVEELNSHERTTP